VSPATEAVVIRARGPAAGLVEGLADSHRRSFTSFTSRLGSSNRFGVEKIGEPSRRRDGDLRFNRYTQHSAKLHRHRPGFARAVKQTGVEPSQRIFSKWLMACGFGLQGFDATGFTTTLLLTASQQ